MRVTDLGDIGPQAILFGGPAANLHAFERLRDVARARGMSATAVICTGDVIGVGGDAGACLEAVRDFGGPVISGDQDLCVVSGQGGVDWAAQARAILLPDALAWLAARPEALVFWMAGKRYAVVHGGANDPARLIWPTDPDDVLNAEIAAVTDRLGAVDGIISGHCGVPFHRRVGDVDWISVGSIARPPHDGRPDTRFVHMTPQHARFLRLTYDVAAAQAAMVRVGRAPQIIAELESGLWHDASSLPPALQTT